MSDDNEDIKDKLDKFKPKKKKMAVPTEFLDNAKSYDDKLLVVKAISEKEKNRVVLIIKGMLKDGIEKKKKV